MQREPENAPASEREAKKAVGQSFLAAALLPEDDGDGDVEKRRGDDGREREFIGGVCSGPDSDENSNQKRLKFPRLALRINLRAEKKENGGDRKEPMVQRALERTGNALRHEGRGEVVKPEHE